MCLELKLQPSTQQGVRRRLPFSEAKFGWRAGHLLFIFQRQKFLIKVFKKFTVNKAKQNSQPPHCGLGLTELPSSTQSEPVQGWSFGFKTELWLWLRTYCPVPGCGAPSVSLPLYTQVLPYHSFLWPLLRMHVQAAGKGETIKSHILPWAGLSPPWCPALAARKGRFKLKLKTS